MIRLRLTIPGKDKRGPHYLGTHREIADRNLRSYRWSLFKARTGLGNGNVEVIKDMIDKWLEYRHQHQKDGTLDKKAYL